ncbi:hypothetical protein KR054_006664 [Drosophila jambulina]|nr:hypothetical protein KR054_006664 [Drosophila jambulina]
MLSNGTAGVAVAVDCDERTRLLSDEIVVVNVAASAAAPSSSVGVAAPVPPTSLPLVHTTATTTAPAAAAATNNNVNNNNNAMVVVSAKNTVNNANTHTNTNRSKSNSNNNNAAAATAAAGATEQPAEATADDEDLSSDLSDKFPRPQKKPGKLSKLGTKSVGLKRVSFGSSKGSMVETLVFETPTPLSEHVESTFGFDAAAGDSGNHPSAAAAAGQLPLASTLASHLPLAGGGYSGDYAKGNMDDSGIEVQEESERSIVRVSIYESSQPQQPDYLPDDSLAGDGYPYNTNDLDLYPAMAATAAATGMMQQQTLGLGAAYDRQQSTDSGWDNPFRPGGDLSREADEIVSMIRGGQPITPTEDRTIGNGSTAQHPDDNCNGGGAAIGESVTKTNLSQNLATAQNGTNSHASATAADAGAGKAGKASDQLTSGGGNNNGVTSLGQVSKQVVPGPISASHVVIDEKKSKKKGCCVVQ